MPWFHRSRKFFDLLEEYGSSWDDCGPSVSILVIASYIWDVGEAYLITPCEYVRYSDIVRTMPTYLLWPLGIWSGSLFCDLCACGLLLTFSYDSERTTLALWLFMTGYWLRSRPEHSTLLDGLELWEDISVWRAVLEMEHEVPMLFCIARVFCIGIWVEHFVLY